MIICSVPRTVSCSVTKKQGWSLPTWDLEVEQVNILHHSIWREEEKGRKEEKEEGDEGRENNHLVIVPGIAQLKKKSS